jgi:hypothetical protein
MSYPGPQGVRTGWQVDPALPVEGSVELPMPVEELWRIFRSPRGWSRWNSCFWAAGVTGGRLETGRTLLWAFEPIRPEYLYKLPAVARLVDVVPGRRVTWEVTALPGFLARHTYWMEPIGNEACRFGSWEVADGPLYLLLRPFWLAHFRFVRDASLAGVERLPGLRRPGQPPASKLGSSGSVTS